MKKLNILNNYKKLSNKEKLLYLIEINYIVSLNSIEIKISNEVILFIMLVRREL